MSIRLRRLTKHLKGCQRERPVTLNGVKGLRTRFFASLRMTAGSRNRREVQVEREFSAGPREDGELGLRERIEVAVREGCDHLGAIGRGFRPGGRAVGRVVRADSHRHDLSVALDEHDEGVLREVTAVAVERDGYLKVLV